MPKKPDLITRDISWLSFNARVLQEAKDSRVHIYDRVKFLGIFSNNLDEFFRVRVATLNRMAAMGKSARVHLEERPDKILEKIQIIVIQQQLAFESAFSEVIGEMAKQHIHLLKETELNEAQQDFVRNYFEDQVRTAIVPLMIESIPQAPVINDQSIYLACVLGSTVVPQLHAYALIEVPTNLFPRFVILPSAANEHAVILLEDLIRYNLPALFASFGYNRFMSHIIKISRDAELDIDIDEKNDIIEELERSLRKRKKGRATRFVYDKKIDEGLLQFLIKKLGLTKRDNLIPGGRIHNFKDFIDFPKSIFPSLPDDRSSIVHPLLKQPIRILSVLDEQDILLNFPYHRFESIVDLLREAAIDPFVYEIKITAYRLAKHSKIINALVNAARNGKDVSVMIELRARFDEAHNLYWKEKLEEEGVKVFVGVPNMKVHAKLILIKKRAFDKQQAYAFISTGNINENTARFYGDHGLLTSNKTITRDVAKIFEAIEGNHPDFSIVKQVKSLVVAPYNMRDVNLKYIDQEIEQAKAGKPASIIIKLNSLVDKALIEKLYDAAHQGVKVNLIIRGICCAITEHPYLNDNLRAISIIDEYLEHARVMVYYNQGQEIVLISSADWMVRNLDHRVEAAVPIEDEALKRQLIDMLIIQLNDNSKARILNNKQDNQYVPIEDGAPVVRSQVDIYKYLEASSQTLAIDTRRY